MTQWIRLSWSEELWRSHGVVVIHPLWFPQEFLRSSTCKESRVWQLEDSGLCYQTQVNPVLNLPDQQVRVFQVFKYYRRTVKMPTATNQFFFKLVKMIPGQEHDGYSLPEGLGFKSRYFFRLFSRQVKQEPKKASALAVYWRTVKLE